MDDLLKTVLDTRGNHYQLKQLSIYSKLYKGFMKKKFTFPVHDTLKDSITAEWKQLEKRLFLISRNFSFLKMILNGTNVLNLKAKFTSGTCYMLYPFLG